MKAKKPTGRHSRQFSAGNTLVGLFVGLIVGVLAAAAVVCSEEFARAHPEIGAAR